MIFSIVRLEELPHCLEVKFHHRHRVLKLEVLKHFRVQYSNASNSLSFKQHISSSLVEELLIFSLRVFTQLIVLVQASSNLSHQQAKGSMDHFEGSLGVQLHEANFASILWSSVGFLAEWSGLTDFKHFLWNSFFLVALQYLEETRDQWSAHHLKLKSLGVREQHSLFHVRLIPHVVVVLLDWEQRASETLNETSLGQFMSKQISELILRDKATHGVGWRVNHRDIVEAITHSDFFSNVASVQDIWSHGRHIEFHFIIGLRLKRVQSHLHSGSMDLLFSQSDAQHAANVFNFSLESLNTERRLSERSQTIMSLVINLNRLHSELRLTLAVLRELGGEDGEDDLAFSEVSACDFNEHILGVERNLGSFWVDDGRQGQHSSVGIIEHRVDRAILNNWQVFLELEVLAKNIE
jgi:hypothetical protein